MQQQEVAVERRAAVRHRVFRIEVRVASLDSFRASYLRDVSTGGLFVRSAKPLPVGTRVMVQLTLAALEPVALPGEVVRLEPTGFGVRFSTLDEKQQTSLDALLASVEPTLARVAATTWRQTADQTAVLSAQLAEARGAIEGYEQTLARLRESEMEAVMRAELAEFERTVLVEGMKELTARVASLEHEKLRQGLDDDEVQALRHEAQKLSQSVDEERLKTLAVQRALERFLAMGGAAPVPPEGADG
jgi:uncharacterized protein (TIGR02266 family)